MYSKKQMVEFVIYWIWPAAWLVVFLLAFVLIAYIESVRP